MPISSISASGDPMSPFGQPDTAKPSIAIGLHVPTSAISFGGQNANTLTQTSAPRRNHPQSAVQALPTLPEASHANALHAATGPSPAALGLSPELDANTAATLAGLTATQRTLALSRSQGYDIIALELANERWKERWERLCLANPSDAIFNQPTSSSGVTAPTVQLSPWTANSTDPATSIARSSSRHGLASGSTSKPPASPVPNAGISPSFMQTAREAEEWRRGPAFKRGEVNITKLDEAEGLIILASPWIELDSPDEGIRLDSELALRQELAYASYLGISNVVIPPPLSDPARRPFLSDYARAINSCLSGNGSEGAPAGTWMNLSVRLPISSPDNLAKILARQAQRGQGTSSSSSASFGSTTSAISSATAAALLRAEDDWAWETWEHIRQVCSYNTRLQVALDFTYPIPSPQVLARWTAEPISSLWVPSTAYLANAKGFPVLSKAAQSFIRSMIKKSPSVIVSGVQNPPANHARGGPLAYLQYIRHLEKSAPPDSAVDTFALGYTDWLQAPLQPLMDNLEGTTYEVFERDPVKYALYEEAIFKALLDRPASTTTIIWVCGAGRGPLVDRCLNAAERSGRMVRITALEKNPNAFVTLQERQALDWGDVVQVKFGDMRKYPVPTNLQKRPDIIVSELLGSFGDNELSPECLDGAMRFLKPDGISIPSSYTAYLSPLSSSKLHTEVLNGTGSSNQAVQKTAETPYVVLFQNVALLAATGGRQSWDQVQESWSFEHRPSEVTALVYDTNGLPVTNGHNVRSASHTFHIPQAGTCHGLAGYFEAHLYADVALSIHPDPMRGSKDMLSWFPIYFPFKEPLYLPANSELDVHFWRLSGNNKVWYEWCAEVFLPLPSDIAKFMNGGNRLDASSSQLNSLNPSNGHLSAAQSGSTATVETHNFANAPTTPRIPSGSAVVPSHHDVNHHAFLTNSFHNTGSTTRIKTGMTALHNPGGRSSWIGL